MIPDAFPEFQRNTLIDPAIMGPPAVYLASDDAIGVNGQRIIAAEWKAAYKATDEKRPVES
jgi:hypothetical protein